MRALVVIAAIVAIAGCKCIDPSQPARYLCTPDAGSADQCPGGWRCALDGFCVDPEKGAPLSCRDAVDCTGGWFCGLAGTCVDSAQPAAYACADDTHCTPSWRCGLEGTCHERDAGAAYLCAGDEDCEARWRCGPDGLCVDAVADALPPTPDGSGLLGIRIHPKLPVRLPDAISANTDGVFGGCTGEMKRGTTVSLVHGTRFIKWVDFGVQGWGYDCAGSEAKRLAGDVAELTLPSQPVEVLDLGDATLAVFADGGIARIAYTPRAGLTLSMLTAPFPVAHVRGRSFRTAANAPAQVAAPVVFGATRVAMVNGTTFVEAQLPRVDGGAPVVFDAVFSGAERPGSGLLYAGTNSGLLAADLTGTFFDGGRVVLDGCSVPLAVRQLQLFDAFPNQPEHLAALVEFDRNGQRLTHFTSTLSGIAANCGYEPVKSGGYFGEAMQYPCPTSVPGFFFKVENPGGVYDGYVREIGRSGDGGDRTASCTGALVESLTRDTMRALHASARYSTTNSSTLALADDRGALWIVRGVNPDLRVEPLTLSEIPAQVSGLLDRSLAWSPPVRLPMGQSSSANVRGTVFQRDATRGYPLAPVGLPLLAHVAGEPKWQLTQMDLGQGPFYLVAHQLGLEEGGILAKQGTPLEAPFTAAVSRAAAGQTTIVIGAADVLAHVDVTGLPDGGIYPQTVEDFELAPKIRFGTTPLAGGTITSLAALPPGGQPQSAYALGYAVVNGRVFRFKADNAVVFRSDEVVIEPNEAIAVWADGARGRAGFASGTVYGLPSRAKLAGPVPGTTPVHQFESVCGTTFALTDEALWRLDVAPGATVGTWRAVPLESSDAGIALTGARMYGQGSGLTVHRARGFVDELTSLCP